MISSVYSVCSGCGISGQNPLLWPERKSLHCFGHQPGYRWWKSLSKRIKCTLRRLFCVYCGLQDIKFSLDSQQRLMLLVLLLRLPWLLAEIIMTLVARTAPSEKPQMCTMDLPSVQVCHIFATLPPTLVSYSLILPYPSFPVSLRSHRPETTLM